MDVNTIGTSAAALGQNSTGVTTPSPAIATPAPAADPPASSAASSSSSSGSAPPSLAQVKQAVDNINASLNANGNSQNVQFAVDPNSKRVVVQVIDQQTDKVIRQIPSEEIIQMSMTLGQKLGQVINQQA
ncbi:flagellar protein FlaG [Sapientia aquatica]|uniref:Flagellar protein FlaG n=1 Tax=Sapientia aquatica TaxID=1549640 RepID=A0A4R5W0I7_9BURK|nr:flagellar protein FlaG [Sapientia aquatica]TDK65541.1 flagellar protein FlaG [Sapientia aquatica]